MIVLRCASWNNNAVGFPAGDLYDPGYRRLRYVRYAELCQARHKSAYADCLVMPREAVESLVGGVGMTVWSA
jgi:hypothetical protein